MKQLRKTFVILVLPILFLTFTECEFKPFSFVQLTDTQLGFGGYAHDKQSFEQAVKQINELNPDFVIICGDLVNVANDSSFTAFNEIKKKLKMPCYCVAGNHDVQNIPNDTTLAYYRNVIGKDYYSFEHKGCSFIITNTQLWKANVKNESADHDRWFRETLINAGSKNKTVFVAGHSPLFVTEPNEKSEYFNIPLEKRQELFNLLNENHVVAYLSGHSHKTIINKYGNIQLVCSETTSRAFDSNPLGFRLWEISPDSIKHKFVPLVLK